MSVGVWVCVCVCEYYSAPPPTQPKLQLDLFTHMFIALTNNDWVPSATGDDDIQDLKLRLFGESAKEQT